MMGKKPGLFGKRNQHEWNDSDDGRDERQGRICHEFPSDQPDDETHVLWIPRKAVWPAPHERAFIARGGRDAERRHCPQRQEIAGQPERHAHGDANPRRNDETVLVCQAKQDNSHG